MSLNKPITAAQRQERITRKLLRRLLVKHDRRGWRDWRLHFSGAYTAKADAWLASLEKAQAEGYPDAPAAARERPTKANGRWTNWRRPCPVCRDGRRLPTRMCARCQAKRGRTIEGAPLPPADKGPYHDAA